MRRAGLGLKAALVLVAIALAPLVAAAVLIDQMAEVAQNFASHQAARLVPPLDQAQGAYRERIATKKRLYQEAAAHLAAELDRPGGAPEAAALRARFEAHPDLLAIELDGARSARPTDLAPPPPRHRPLEVEAGGGRVRLVFAADLALAEAYQELGRVLVEARQVESLRGDLPRSYRYAFLALLGGVVIVAAATGVLLARRLTRRIDRLVAGTRQVATGDLSTRVALGGRDELAELGAAFDRMVEELDHDRGQILHLQRMSAWQDVARRLAHEIKNPLTPIQLAVQQLQSSYDGADPRHARMLADAAEIVAEEIAGLRRLVDAFRELGKLPEVVAAPLDLAIVVDDVAREVSAELALAPPPAPVVVQGDRLLLRRVLANLVENGAQAGQGAGKPGRVALAWRLDPASGRAEVTVDDEGPGVAPADRARIFEPYVTTKSTGTGLGLAIARKIALDHGGDLEVAPAASPLGGARFVLRLPVAAAENAEGDAGAPPSSR